MAPSISILKRPPHNYVPPALSIKLNSEVISQFKTCLAKGARPKLVVKDGSFVCIELGHIEPNGVKMT